MAEKWGMNTFTFGRIRVVGECPTNQYKSIPLFGVMVSEVTNMRVESICDDNFGFVMDGLCQFTWLLAQERYFWIHFAFLLSGSFSWINLTNYNVHQTGLLSLQIMLFHTCDKQKNSKTSA